MSIISSTGNVAGKPVVRFDELPLDETRADWTIEELTFAYAEMSGLHPNSVLLSPFGELYPTMPKPIRGNDDGSGRLPKGVSLQYTAWNPVFWMGDSRLQRQDEDMYEWHIRLYLELVALDMFNIEQRRFRDPLLLYLGIDIDNNQEDRQRVQRYIDGYTGDAELNSFYLITEDGLPRGWSKHEARALYEQSKAVYNEEQAVWAEDGREILQEAEDNLHKVNVAPPVSMLSGYLQKLAVSARSVSQHDMDTLINGVSNYAVDITGDIFIVDAEVRRSAGQDITPSQLMRDFGDKLTNLGSRIEEIRNSSAALFMSSGNFRQKAADLYSRVHALLYGLQQEVKNSLAAYEQRSTVAIAVDLPELQRPGSSHSKYSVITAEVAPEADT